MIKKFMVEKVMVEKSGVESSRVEARFEKSRVEMFFNLGLVVLNDNEYDFQSSSRVVQYNFELDSWTVHSFYPNVFTFFDEVACSQISDKTNQK